MRAAEDRVDAWLQSRGFMVRRFTKQEIRSGIKTPDFRALHSNQPAFLCEVKAVVEGTSSGVELKNPVLSQLSEDIHDACKKFRATNVDHQVPNVLAFVQCGGLAGVDYLEDILLGAWHLESGRIHPVFGEVANGRIKHEKAEIDLYLWHDEDGKVWFRFNDRNQHHVMALCTQFGIDPASMAKASGREHR